MNFLEILRFAFRGLTINRLRTFLTTLGIMIGVSSVIILTAVGNGSSKAVQSSLDRLGTNSIQVRSGSGGFGLRARAVSNNTKPLTVDDAVALINPTQAPDIKSAAPVMNANATCVNGTSTSTPATFSGTWPTYFEASNTAIAKGVYFSNDDVTQGRRVAVIGNTTATELFGTDNPIGQTVRCGGIPFTIIGTTEVKGSSGFQDGDSLFLAPITAVQNSLTGYQPLSTIIVEAKSAKTTDAAQTEIQTILDARHKVKSSASRDYRLFNQATLLATSSSSSKVFTVLLAAVAGISLLVGGIGITNIMLVTVIERTREIGIRKAIGAPKRAILSQFLIEATILSLVGGALGVLGGLVGSHFTIVGVKPVIMPSSIFLAFGVSVLIGLFFGGYPASRAASLRPIEALRYE
ncbi:MAG: ABC transporter permease [Actinomycetes bacterium]